MIETSPDLLKMVKPRQRISGVSAIILAFTETGAIDWDGFCGYVACIATGITPAVNMDTGYVNILELAYCQMEYRRIGETLWSSDTLLGLSTLAPELFAKRDAPWSAGEPDFYQLNDLLQYLSFLAFCSPVQAYQHRAAQFLKLRGWVQSNAPHRERQGRADSDGDILRDIVHRLEKWD